MCALNLQGQNYIFVHVKVRKYRVNTRLTVVILRVAVRYMGLGLPHDSNGRRGFGIYQTTVTVVSVRALHASKGTGTLYSYRVLNVSLSCYYRILIVALCILTALLSCS